MATPQLQPDDIAQWRQWWQAADASPVVEALPAMWEAVDAAVRERGPRCDASGRCCDFEGYGHRLYVTGLEVAWFLRQVTAEPDEGKAEASDAEPSRQGGVSLPVVGEAKAAAGPGGADVWPVVANYDGGGCPFQVGKLCSTHAVRPLGCRVYFCEPGTDDWQHALYERFLTQLRELHEEIGLPYRYMEWRAGLREASLAIAGQS